jgi:hypothetical protein
MGAVQKITDHPYSSKWSEYWAVQSESRPDVTYVVAKARKDGTWACSCPRWIYKRENCKHITRAVSKARLVESNHLVGEVRLDAMPEKVRKAISRFSLIEL